MSSKLSLILLVFIFFPTSFAFATEDILLVTLRYNATQNTAEIIKVEQRTRDAVATSNATSENSIAVELSDSGGVVSHNTYNPPSPEGFIEILGGPDVQPIYAPAPPENLVSVTLPLSRSLDATESTVTVKKDGLTLTQKKISEVPFEILGGEKYTVKKEYVRKGTAATTGAGTSSKLWSTLLSLPLYILLIPIGILLALFALIIVMMHKSRKPLGDIPIIPVSETPPQQPTSSNL